ncbi:MAG: hypothetical protein EPO52_17265 [Herbiconiux sp.]|uniref:hypothetical protein n=1 Tax=Herbiconiux sp. TaxID=1871186 RepID=UPI0011F8B722|nr:hypothetical protein [Herbiconiux sp.]TAJ46287.1 MAG: hypothetical protein EPO52_17265 [Herbiconiux sp.]
MSTPCESCSMPIESGRYCAYCTDEHGELQDFEVRFAAMVDWQQRSRPEDDRAALEADTLEFMASMPAWREHPRVVGR